MSTEELSIAKTEAGNEHNDAVPERFPIVDDEKIYYFNHMPEWREGQIIHFIREGLGGDKEAKKNCFILLKTITGLHYHFYLAEYFGAHLVSFKTEEYEYATVNLDKKSLQVLAKTLSVFFESIADYTNNDVREIRVNGKFRRLILLY